MRQVHPPTPADLAGAEEVVRRFLPVTPVVAAPLLGEDVHLKLELLQPTGSFKVRGGLAAVAAAHRRQPDVPLVAASAGNHGLGVAYAADRLGCEATVVVAENAAPAKVRALHRYGAALVRHGTTYDEAEAHALELAEAKGWHFVSPYNDPDVIAGQATLGRELLSQVPDMATLVVPLGGGGLLSGVGLATEGTGVHLVGVEPEHAAAMMAAVAAGRVVPVELGPTMADGLAGNLEEGSVTVDLARRLASELLTVSEGEIAEAVRFLAFDVGLVVEGAGAVGVAVVRNGTVSTGRGPAVVLITGRNISAELLVQVLSAGPV
ncbi:MAG TPA: pyridoxal-phosphate dependent enzyme [Acidimicrobiales bacterium]|nr:pyridoxal-phosphate dependent enzyme [Acidimicrobiales bacterium]